MMEHHNTALKGSNPATEDRFANQSIQAAECIRPGNRPRWNLLTENSNVPRPLPGLCTFPWRLPRLYALVEFVLCPDAL